MMEWPKFFMALVTGAAEQQAAAREASSAARSRAIVVALLFPHAPLPTRRVNSSWSKPGRNR